MSGLIDFIKCNKDLFTSLQNCMAMLVIIIGAIWAIPRLKITRPFQRRLAIQSSAKALKIGRNKILIHVGVSLKNTGIAMFPLDDYHDSRYRSWVRIFGIHNIDKQVASRPNWIDWEDRSTSTILFEGWFTDSPNLELEGGEEESMSNDLLISEQFKTIHIWLKVYERYSPLRQWLSKKNIIHRPYFWSDRKTYELKDILKPS